MSDYLTNLLAAAWALRYVALFALLLLVTALWLEARRDRDRAWAKARRLYLDNIELKTRLARPWPAANRPIIGGRVIP